MSRRREFRNDVMHDAFLMADIGEGQINSPLVKWAMRAARRFRPSRFGGWRVKRGG